MSKGRGRGGALGEREGDEVSKGRGRGGVQGEREGRCPGGEGGGGEESKEKV